MLVQVWQLLVVVDMALYREQNSSGKNRFLGFLFPVQDMSKVCMHLCVHFHSVQISDTEISVPCCSTHIALRYGEVQILILVWFMGFLLLHSLSFCELVGFLGFLLLHTLSFCESVGFLGFLLLHTLSFCELVGFLGFLGFLLLHTLSFCELVGFLGFLLLHTLSF